MVEQRTPNPRVLGSSPSAPAKRTAQQSGSFLYIKKLKAMGMTKRGSMSIVGVKKNKVILWSQ